MNLTDQQKDLLRLLVSKHESLGGVEFLLARSSGGAGLIYAGDGASVPIGHDDSDFYQLRDERCITLTLISDNVHRGKPTQLGITSVSSSSKMENGTPPASDFSVYDDLWKANPFPEGTRAHQSWLDLVLWAKEHLALFQAELLESMPPEDASSNEFLEHHLKALAGVFDIWARGFAKFAPLTNQGAIDYEGILDELERWMIAQGARFRLRFIPERLFLSETTRRVKQRRQFWTGQMLRIVREHNEARGTKVAGKEKGGAASDAGGDNVPKVPAQGDGDTAPEPQEAATLLAPILEPLSPKPHLPLAVRESVAGIEDRSRLLLKGCRHLAPNGYRLSFDVTKAIEILRTCAAEAFDKQAEHFVSLEAFRPQWRRDVVNQTLTSTLALVDPLDLIVNSVPPIEVEVRRTVEAGFERWKRSQSRKQSSVESRNLAGDIVDRRAAVDAYIEEVSRSGKRITRTDIWKSAGYKSRTEFERWERNDPNKRNRTADQRFTKILAEKPHLK